MIACLNQDIGFITLAVGLISAIAIFFAPIVTLWRQKKVEILNEEKQRRLNIFKTLLVTRANPISLEHVQALNMIDIEFHKEKNIINTWNIYRDHLNSYPQNQDAQDQKRWQDKGLDYLTDLLFSMSTFFGYDFDKVILKKGGYLPIAHHLKNRDENLIRSELIHLLKVLNEERLIKVELSKKEPTDKSGQ